MIKKHFILVVAIFLLFYSTEFAAEVGATPKEDSEDINSVSSAGDQEEKKEPVQVTADKLEMLEEKDLVIGKGNVDIHYKGTHVQADTVRLNSKTGKGVATGNVLMEDKESHVRSEKTFFDINTSKGVLFNAKGQLASEYFFTGSKINKVGEDRYKVHDGTLTTCFGDAPAWLFKCDKADLTLENYALLKNPKFYIKDIPVLYLPYAYIPLKTKRATGFLFPTFGSSDKDGFFINNSFFWAIDEQMDATLSLDYLKKKGLRPGLEFRYTPTRNIAGQFNGAYLKESDTDRELWKIDFNHKQNLDNGIRATAKVDLLSDNNYDKSFSNSTLNRTRRISDSYITLSKNWKNRSLEVLTRYRKSLEFNQEQKYSLLPQVTFRNQREKILNTPIYFNLESSYTGFDREINSVSNNVQRVDVHPQFSVPLTALPWMTFTPAIGLRETFYSEGVDSSGKSAGSFGRELYDISMSLEGPKLSKIFSLNSSAVPKVKHIIEPRITYKYIPDTDKEDISKIIVFDGVDSFGSSNAVQYSLTNRFLEKLLIGDDSYTTEEVLRFDISQSYDFKEASKDVTAGVARRPFSNIRWDIDSHIWAPFRLNVDGTYDINYDHELKSANIELAIVPGGIWSAYFERRYIKDQSTFLLGTLGLNFKNGWTAKYSARYDEKNSELQENNLSVSYAAQCWDVALDYINRNTFINGQKESENKYFIYFTLKGIGSIGSKNKLPMIHRGL